MGQENRTNLIPFSEWSITEHRFDQPSEVKDWSSSPITENVLKYPSSTNDYWFKLPRKALPDSGFIRIPGQNEIKLFENEHEAFRLGFVEPMHQLPVKGKPGYFDISTLSEKTNQIYIQITPYNEQPSPVILQHITADEFPAIQNRRTIFLLPYFFFIGGGVIALFILSAFAVFLYFENRKKAYLFYAGYMVSMALYFERLLEYHYQIPIFWGYLFRGYAVAEVVGIMAANIMYFLFIRYFLSIDQKIPKLIPIIRTWVIICSLMGLSEVISSAIEIQSDLLTSIFFLVRIIMIPLIIYMLWVIYRKRIKYTSYIIWGSSFLLMAGIAAMSVSYFFPRASDTAWNNPYLFMMAGVLLESFCFALGLGRQAKQEELDKIEAQKQLIVQIQKEASLERKIQDSRIQTLTAQMNPHFIFNALNSIQHFILSNQKEKSVKYLSRFAKLIRGILQNSTAQTVSLEDELDTLKSYVELEQLRFHPAFKFDLQIDPAIVLEDTHIPHMVIQPFIENAILHGLSTLKGNGKLTLYLNKADAQSLNVTIMDNGIGRTKAMEIKRGKEKKHHSISVDSIRERLRVLQPNVNHPVIYEDLNDYENQPSGTKVVITLPIISQN
jgi:sensor histidine kinase YesM